MERLAGGATVGEIATAWGRSERSVYRALTDVKRRLGARTDMHAIALWLAHWPSSRLLVPIGTTPDGRRNGTTLGHLVATALALGAQAVNE